jgi:hypothetical protein
LAVVAAVIIILLSHADKAPIQPIKETTAKAERHKGEALAEKDPVGKPIPNAPTRTRQIIRRTVKVKRPISAPLAHPRSAPAARRPARKHRRKRARHHRARTRGGHRGAPVTPLAAPTTAPAASPAPAASAPAPPPAVPAQPAPAPEVRPVEIQIEDGDLATGFNFVVYSRGERVRLHVTSDESVVVQIPGYGITQPIAAGGSALIEFDATSTGLYEVKLRGKKGITLALIRVRD